MKHTVTLVIGPRRLAESISGTPNAAELITVAVPPEALSPATAIPGALHTVRLDWRVPVRATLDPGSGCPRTIVWRDLFPDMLAGEELHADASLAPLWLLVETYQGVHLFAALRHMLSDALFVRLDLEAVPHASVEALCRLAAERQREHSLILNNHQCYYRRLFPGEEIEHKYTLSPDTDIWAVALRLYQAVREGELPGFIPEYGDEFQAWDYLNHLFAIPEPAEERGYVSFIPLSVAGYTIKRKWFDEDATRRGEKYQPAPAGIADLAEHVRVTMGLPAAEQLPTFRRIRYDLNLESLRTGHVFGIFFDHSVILDGPMAELVQCELEYIRTRSALRQAEAVVLEELEEVATWLEQFLAAEGLSSERGVYSKLSFLRDAVAGRAIGAPAGERVRS